MTRQRHKRRYQKRPGIQEAARTLGVTYSYLLRCLKGIVKSKSLLRRYRDLKRLQKLQPTQSSTNPEPFSKMITLRDETIYIRPIPQADASKFLEKFSAQVAKMDQPDTSLLGKLLATGAAFDQADYLVRRCTGRSPQWFRKLSLSEGFELFDQCLRACLPVFASVLKPQS